MLSLFVCICLSPCGAFANTELKLSDTDAVEIGHKVWRNECGGTIEGLTSWNFGEEFPSLGIGHFIWYPEGVKGRFDESFPKVLKFLQEKGSKLPEWLSPGMACPWKSREEFLQDQKGRRMTELRKMLSSTVGLQTDYIVQRLEAALPKMLEKTEPENRAKIEKQFQRVLQSGKQGVFALIDYVNFKGEGIVETERYKGEGWGMLQVLHGMSETEAPVKAFVESAIKALTLRVQNSPPERGEARWLPGWTNRLNAYLK